MMIFMWTAVAVLWFVVLILKIMEKRMGLTTTNKLNRIYKASVIERYMRMNDLCKYAYKKLIDAELPKNKYGASQFIMTARADHGFLIKVEYYDFDERYDVSVEKTYDIPVKDDNVELYKYMKRLGLIKNVYCFESPAKSDAEIMVRDFDDMFTKRCREEKIKFSGYGEYRFWRDNYKKFLREAAEHYYDSSFLKKFEKATN